MSVIWDTHKSGEWRKYFTYLGFTQECEDISRGYTIGLACWLIFMAVCCVLLALDIFKPEWLPVWMTGITTEPIR